MIEKLLKEEKKLNKAQLPQFGVLPPMNVQAIVDAMEKSKAKKSAGKKKKTVNKVAKK